MSAPKAKGQPKGPTLAAQNRARVEATFPGLTCTRVAHKVRRLEKHHLGYGLLPNNLHHSLNICVTGSAEDLIRHGLLTQEMVDELPPSGRRPGFERLFDGRFRYSAHWWDDGHDVTTAARDMAARIGLTAKSEAPPSNVIPFPRAPFEKAVRSDDPRAELLALFADLNADGRRLALCYVKGLTVRETRGAAS